MRTHNARRYTHDELETGFVGIDTRASEARSMQLISSTPRPGPHRSFGRSTREPPLLSDGITELLTDIDGFPVLVRLVVQDVPAETRAERVKIAEVHSRLSSTLETMVERMRGSPIRGGTPSNEPLAIVELISSGARLGRVPPAVNETVLRVGPLELDLIDRTARRGDRQIDLRPREFQLLKYMMQRSDNLLTRAALFKEVWHYNFVPETNLVDVHMGRLRHKVDGSNEAPMIRNVRGVGFVLSATPISLDAPARATERPTTGQ
jgi:DNA-binding winged helix-turn-helix (wHTH) protein